MRTALLVAGVAALLLAAGVGAMGADAPASLGGDALGRQVTPGPTTSPPTPQPATPRTTACDYASLYDRTIGSVVAVRTDAGLGSGFVYRTLGNGSRHVVTNAHVVGDADSVIVQFTGGESVSGAVTGRDRFTDLAVVRVDEAPGYAGALPVAGSPPDHGQPVAAMGNPFGLEETITHGIASGLNRSLSTRLGFTIPDVVQTDAPISPGNSGGPLLTCDGTVVGVNTAGIASVRAENIGFAVSSTTVERVVPALIETGEYEHAYLGVRTTPITPRVVAANEFETTSGVYVDEVVEGGPADGALQGTTDSAVVDGERVPLGGDVIVAVDDRQVASGEDLSSHLLAETSPGEAVTLTVVRDGERQQVEVTLGERPDPATG